jgi:hypothetical protein
MFYVMFGRKKLDSQLFGWPTENLQLGNIWRMSRIAGEYAILLCDLCWGFTQDDLSFGLEQSFTVYS